MKLKLKETDMDYALPSNVLLFKPPQPAFPRILNRTSGAAAVGVGHNRVDTAVPLFVGCDQSINVRDSSTARIAVRLVCRVETEVRHRTCLNCYLPAEWPGFPHCTRNYQFYREQSFISALTPNVFAAQVCSSNKQV